jgi:hypothetical protein
MSERVRRALDVLAGQALDEGVYVVRARPTTVRARPGSGLVLGDGVHEPASSADGKEFAMAQGPISGSS